MRLKSFIRLQQKFVDLDTGSVHAGYAYVNDQIPKNMGLEYKWLYETKKWNNRILCLEVFLKIKMFFYHCSNPTQYFKQWTEK